MSDLIIKNGHVIDPLHGIDGRYTIVVKDGKIHDLIKSSVNRETKTIDADDAIVCPGFVDIHVHLREPGHEYKEDIESGSKAASAGGFATICCMPNTEPVNDNVSVSEYIMKRAKEVGLVNILPVGAITKGLKGEGLADIGDQASLGVAAITDDGRSVMNSLLLRRAAEYASSFGLTIMDHCEDKILSHDGVMNEGETSTYLGLPGIPSASEEIHVARDIAIARQTGTHIHITHVSTAVSLELIRNAKKRGMKITCDVTPHHLTLTEEAAVGYDTNTKMNPPLRTKGDVAALVKGLADGTVDAIATDHAPQGIIDKELGYDTAAFGVIGLETALPVVLKLVHDKKITLKRMIELFTNGLNCLKGSKGQGLKGAVADMTIFDPDAKVTIDSNKFYSKGRNTPFNGWRLKGKVLYTIVGGRVVFNNSGTRT